MSAKNAIWNIQRRLDISTCIQTQSSQNSFVEIAMNEENLENKQTLTSTPLAQSAAPRIPQAMVDLDCMSVIDAYPQLRELPPKEAQVIMLYAAGMTIPAIADYIPCSQSTVSSILGKHDITRVIRRGVEIQKLLIANSLGSIMISAISQIKQKSKDIQAMPVSSLMKLISDCVQVQKHINPPEREKSDDTMTLLQALRDKSPKTT